MLCMNVRLYLTLQFVSMGIDMRVNYCIIFYFINAVCCRIDWVVFECFIWLWLKISKDSFDLDESMHMIEDKLNYNLPAIHFVVIVHVLM